MIELTLPTQVHSLRSENGADLASIFSQAGFILSSGGVQGGQPDEWLTLEAAPCTILVRPSENGSDCWRILAPLPWPGSVDRALWSRTLLGANGGLMRHACMAFALDDLDVLVLSGRLYGNAADNTSLARQLSAFHEVWTNVYGLVNACTASPPASADLEMFIAPHRSTSAAHQDEGNAEATQLVIDKLMEIGTDPLLACQVAASGRIQMDDADVHIEASEDGQALLLSVTLGHALLDGEGQAALRLNGDLMDQHGIAMGHGARGHRLIAHWPCNGRPAEEFHECLMALSGLPGVLQSERTVRDPADTDFDALMPYI